MEPVQAFLKKNKRGLGAEKVQEKPQALENSEHTANRKNGKVSSILLKFYLFDVLLYIVVSFIVRRIEPFLTNFLTVTKHTLLPNGEIQVR